jgi:hypothetical protein
MFHESVNPDEQKLHLSRRAGEENSLGKHLRHLKIDSRTDHKAAARCSDLRSPPRECEAEIVTAFMIERAHASRCRNVITRRAADDNSPSSMITTGILREPLPTENQL